MLPLVAALGLLVCTGVLALLASPWRRLSTAIGTFGAVGSCAVGAVSSVRGLLGAVPPEFRFPWDVPFGRIALGLDPLSAAILVPLFILSGLTAIYGRAYLLAHARPRMLGPPVLFFNVLVASMAVVLTSRNGLLFLVAWEVMTLASYLLVTFDHGDADVRRAGWIYLVAAHIGVACLFALFLLIDRQTGSLAFDTFGVLRQVRPGLGLLLFVLALVGFGVKAGIVPLHVWLPEAHAAAPSHVSALMSAVLIKLGLYGILRTLGWLSPASWWGPALILLGLASALIGISLALYQRDLKRVLAYSSVENVGLILVGIGIGYWGVVRGDAALAALGFAGAFLHLWNHALMKGLLFLCAGSVLHGTGTKDLERLGGLLKAMPWTGAAMILGAVSIVALPPLNGFVSEWLLYVGLMHGGLAQRDSGGLLALIAVGVLSFIGGLTLLAFARLVGIGLLGQPRGPPAARAHDPGLSMRAPMLALAVGCVGIALFPTPTVRLLRGVVAQLSGSVPGLSVPWSDSLWALGACNVALWIAVGAFGALLVLKTRRAATEQTWGCGYPVPTPRIQYTAGSFSELFAERLLPPPLRALISASPPRGLFPAPSSFASECSDPLTRGLYAPFFARWAERFSQLRWLQQGALPVYLLYILVTLVLGLGWLSARAWIAP